MDQETTESHEWVENFNDYEAVFKCLNHIEAWTNVQYLRAFMTFRWSDATIAGEETFRSYVHNETAVIVRHDGDYLAVEIAHSEVKFRDALQDLFAILHSLGWKKAEVYHKSITMDRLLMDVGKAIPAHMDFDIVPYKQKAAEVSRELESLVESAREIVGQYKSDDVNDVIAAELNRINDGSEISVNLSSRASNSVKQNFFGLDLDDEEQPPHEGAGPVAALDIDTSTQKIAVPANEIIQNQFVQAVAVAPTEPPIQVQAPVEVSTPAPELETLNSRVRELMAQLQDTLLEKQNYQNASQVAKSAVEDIQNKLESTTEIMNSLKRESDERAERITSLSEQLIAAKDEIETMARSLDQVTQDADQLAGQMANTGNLLIVSRAEIENLNRRLSDSTHALAQSNERLLDEQKTYQDTADSITQLYLWSDTNAVVVNADLLPVGASAFIFDLSASAHTTNPSPVDMEVEKHGNKYDEVRHIYPGRVNESLRWDIMHEYSEESPTCFWDLMSALSVYSTNMKEFSIALAKEMKLENPQLRSLLSNFYGGSDNTIIYQLLACYPEGGSFVDPEPTLGKLCIREIASSSKATLYVLHCDPLDGAMSYKIFKVLYAFVKAYANSRRNEENTRDIQKVSLDKNAKLDEMVSKFNTMAKELREMGAPISISI